MHSFYTEAFLHKAEPYEISPNEAKMVLGVGFFARKDAEKPGLPRVTYDHMTSNGLMHFTVDGEGEIRTQKQVLNLIRKLMRIGTVPTVCIDALRDIQKQHLLNVAARQERAAAHENNIVFLPIHDIEHRPQARPGRVALRSAGL